MVRDYLSIHFIYIFMVDVVGEPDPRFLGIFLEGDSITVYDIKLTFVPFTYKGRESLKRGGRE